jgi:hypothetical protein
MDIITQLKELAGNYDIGAMDTLVEGLSPAQREEYKQEIIDAYDLVYSYGLYDLDCNKVSDPEDCAGHIMNTGALTTGLKISGVGLYQGGERYIIKQRRIQTL